MKNYDEVKIEFSRLNKRDQYKLLLETYEWYQFRNKILALDEYSCKRCQKKEGPIEVEIMNDKELAERSLEISNYNQAFLKWAKENPQKVMKQLLDGTYRGQNSIPTKYKSIGYIVLQIHHKLYFWNKLPWQYDRKDVITLCSDCHKQEHTENTIYMYKDESKEYRKEITVCSKCNGIGYLPQYHYIDNGICWECNGVGHVVEEEPSWI